MVTITLEARTSIQELSLEEGRELLDRQARKYLGISGEDFIRQWDAGAFKADDRPEVARVAILLPFAT